MVKIVDEMEMPKRINKYDIKNRKKYGTHTFEVTIVVEEMNEDMLETVMQVLFEAAHKQKPEIFLHPDDQEYRYNIVGYGDLDD
jgi:hypothetical protein